MNAQKIARLVLVSAWCFLHPSTPENPGGHRLDGRTGGPFDKGLWSL